MWNFLLAFIPRAIVQGIPLLYGSTGEIITEKSGNLNLGIPGVMYVGAISGVIGSFFYERAAGNAAAMNPFLAILIPMLCCLVGSLLMGLLYCFLTVTLRANQNVTGLAMTTFGVGFGNFFGGSIVIEQVFGINGMGRMMLSALREKDIPTVMAGVIITAIMIALGNLVADLLYGVVDPRIRAVYTSGGKKLKKKEAAA